MFGKIHVNSPEHLTHVDPKWDEVDAEILGLAAIRGCEVVHVKDQSGEIIGERDNEGNIHLPFGDRRTYCVLLDSAQYQVHFMRSCDLKSERVRVLAGDS